MAPLKPYIIRTRDSLRYLSTGTARPIALRNPAEISEEELDGEPEGWEPDVLVTPANDGKPSPALLEEGKSFSRNFIVPALHEAFEFHLQHHKEQYEPHGHPLLYYGAAHRSDEALASIPDDGTVIRFFNAVMLPHYRRTGDAGKEERAEILADEAKKWLQNIPYEKFLADDAKAIKPAARKPAARHGCLGMLVPKSLLPQTTEKEHVDHILRCTLPMMPEWLQVIAHRQGMIFSTVEEANGVRHAAGAAMNKRESGHVFDIYVHPEAFTMERAPHILREELIHELQKATPVILQDAREQPKRLYDRWLSEAIPLYNAMIKQRRHPATSLISKTEAGIGSLGVRESCNNNPEYMCMEMLMDVVDSEIYLRRSGLNAQQADAEMTKAFGEGVVRVSKEYYRDWIDYAASIVSQQLGPEKAGELREKWLKDPFTHEIELPSLLPQYAMNFPQEKARQTQR